MDLLNIFKKVYGNSIGWFEVDKKIGTYFLYFLWKMAGEDVNISFICEDVVPDS
jgi:hypothetical protein